MWVTVLASVCGTQCVCVQLCAQVCKDVEMHVLGPNASRLAQLASQMGTDL